MLEVEVVLNAAITNVEKAAQLLGADNEDDFQLGVQEGLSLAADILRKMVEQQGEG